MNFKYENVYVNRVRDNGFLLSLLTYRFHYRVQIMLPKIELGFMSQTKILSTCFNLRGIHRSIVNRKIFLGFAAEKSHARFIDSRIRITVYDSNFIIIIILFYV